MSQAKKAAAPAKPKEKSKAAKPRAVHDGVVRARIDAELKRNVESILAELGLSGSDAIRLLYHHIKRSNGLPFSLKLPNAETRQAMRDAKAGEGTRYRSADDMFKKMGI
jgi:DNA-damage-inducible protein J